MKFYSELKRAIIQKVSGLLSGSVLGELYFRTDLPENALFVKTNTADRELPTENTLPRMRRFTKVQLDDVLTGNEVQGVLPHTKGGTGLSSLSGFARKAIVVNDAETGFEFGSAGGGAVVEVNQTAHGFLPLQPIYHNGTFWNLAQADAEATVAQYVVVEVIDGNNFVAAKFGKFDFPTHGFIVGEDYFLGTIGAGVVTNVEPIAGWSCPLFYIEDANTIHINVYRPLAVTSSGLNYWQRALSADLNADGVIGDLAITGLTVGKKYKVSVTVKCARVTTAENEIQIITFSDVPDWGSWKINFDGQVTDILGYNVTALDVENALINLSNIDPSGVSVSGDFTTGFVVEFVNTEGQINQPEMTIVNNTLQVGAVGGTNEIQDLVFSGTPTGGTFTITFDGQTTSALPYNATPAQVKAALEALNNIDVVTVTPI